MDNALKLVMIVDIGINKVHAQNVGPGITFKMEHAFVSMISAKPGSSQRDNAILAIVALIFKMEPVFFLVLNMQDKLIPMLPQHVTLDKF